MAKTSAERQKARRAKLSKLFDGEKPITIYLTKESKYVLNRLGEGHTYHQHKGQTESYSSIINELICKFYLENHETKKINNNDSVGNLYQAYSTISSGLYQGESINTIREVLLKNEVPIPNKLDKWKLSIIKKLSTPIYIFKKLKIGKKIKK